MAFVIADRVKETSTTTGTGDLTLAGAMTGFRTFGSSCAVGDTCYYALQGVDAGGAPTGEWECGLGTYSGANTLTRTTVTSSSNAGAAVNLSAGTKQVFISMPAVQVAWARERLTAARTYYVRTDGSDNNTGLADTAGGAFLTIQRAVDVVSGTLDLSIYGVTIQCADGTYTEAVVGKTCIGSGSVTISGNSGTPSNVFLNVTGGVVSVPYCQTKYFVTGVKLQATGSCLTATGYGSFLGYGNVVFGTAGSYHVGAFLGGLINCNANYSITGGALVHWNTTYGTINANSRTITLTGTPAFSQAFAQSDRGFGMFDIFSNTFSGAATGKRYALSNNAVAYVAGAATTYLPGDVAGTTANGAQYV